MARSIDVQTFLNEHPFSSFQWMIFALCFCIVLLDGFDTAAIGYIAPSLITEWGVERSALGPVLSAALFGLAFGALFAGPLADRLGRRAFLIGSVLIFGVACLASAFSGSLTQLVIWRFVTGLGLGAAMPNAVTLMSEYCPDGRRATLTNGMFCGFPTGAAFGGFLAAWIIPQFGWRSVFMFGGIVPLLLALLLFLLLPESVRYMVAESYPAERIRNVLRRISAIVPDATSFVMHEKSATPPGKSSIGVVLSRAYLVGSVMLWVAYFMGLVIFYALINWMPTLFRDAGMAPGTAALIAALFPLGGVGAILSGWLMDRFNANIIIAVCFGLTAIGVLRDRPGDQPTRRTDAGRACQRYPNEHSPGVAARARCRILSDARARDGGGLDAGLGPLWRHCRFVSRRRAVAAEPQLHPDFHNRSRSGTDLSGCAPGQAVRAPAR